MAKPSRRRVAAEAKAPKAPPPPAEAEEDSEPEADAAAPPEELPNALQAENDQLRVEAAEAKTKEAELKIAALERQVKGLMDDLRRATANPEGEAAARLQADAKRKDDQITVLQRQLATATQKASEDRDAIARLTKTAEDLRARQAHLLKAQLDATGKVGTQSLGLSLAEVTGAIAEDNAAQFLLLADFKHGNRRPIPAGRILTRQTHHELLDWVSQGMQLRRA